MFQESHVGVAVESLYALVLRLFFCSNLLLIHANEESVLSMLFHKIK